MRKTKNICTIGPASQSPEKIKEMIEAGMNVCRCNFSHGSYEEQKTKMMTVVRISEEMGRPVATLIDTKGPEIRLRNFEEGKVILDLEDFMPDKDDKKEYALWQEEYEALENRMAEIEKEYDELQKRLNK